MNRDRLAEILVSVSDRVKEQWRIGWESQVQSAEASGRSAYNPYTDNEGPENLPGQSDPVDNLAVDPAVAVANRDDICDDAGSDDDENIDLAQELLQLPPLRSPMA